MRAEGGEDEGGMGVSSIKVNGVEHCPKKPGHNIVVLDPIGEVYAARNFNTNAGEGTAMGQFLDQLPEDHVVLVATQGLTSKEQGKCQKKQKNTCRSLNFGQLKLITALLLEQMAKISY